MRIRTYKDLVTYDTFSDRFEYLALNGVVGRETFGFDRYLNQRFYTSKEWKDVRNYVIARDLGNDLGVDGYAIHSRIIIHHMNPMNADDIIHNNVDILNPDYLITTTHDTHNAIHYGDVKRLPGLYKERSVGDTKLW